MKAVGDYIHSKGLKFGIYTDAGTKTCGGRPGLRGYEYQDMRTFASWGVDYVKNDWCNAKGMGAQATYKVVKDAIIASGRPMVHSICEWGFNKPWEWAAESGHLWRTTFDIADCWDCSEMTLAYGVEVENFMGFTKILDLQVGLEPYAGPGHWNDPDMLQVGNTSLTYEENKSHFSLWAILAAPLMLGNDIRNMNDDVKEILTNKEIIALDQNVLGKEGVKVRDDGDFEVWSKQLADGSRGVVLFNRSESPKEMSFKWTEIGYDNKLKMHVRDLWQHKEMGKFAGKYSAKVPAHGVVVVKIYLK
jgi:alpha-galactosidase